MVETVFLTDNKKDYKSIQIKNKGYAIMDFHKKISPFAKIIRRLYGHLGFLPYSIWISDELKNKIKLYECFIIFASRNKIPIIRYINKKNPNARIILWYWNPVKKSLPIKKTAKLSCEKWSFDENDCKKYSMCYNTQFFFETAEKNKENIEYDVVFIGKNKGRKKELIKIQSQFNNVGLKTFFYIVENNKIFSKNHFLPYDEIIKFNKSSKAILDFVSKGQAGLTLRPLEAVFLEKKLITNNQNINMYDFYNEKNVFILGKNDFNSINNFVNSPYDQQNKQERVNYLFDKWVTRFFEN